MKQIFILIVLLVKVYSDDVAIIKEFIILEACQDSHNIILTHDVDSTPGEDNVYSVNIYTNFPKGTVITFKFDSDASVKLKEKGYAGVTVEEDNSFTIRFFKPHNGIEFTVEGVIPGVIPYFTSVIINGNENCEHPLMGVFDEYINKYGDIAVTKISTTKKSCGRRKIMHTELIVRGQSTNAGDWPWHVALYRIENSTLKYICGGTLISKTHVLTFAHCVTQDGVPLDPANFTVVLGKFNLIKEDPQSQKKEVGRVIVHDQFDYLKVNNDIALLILKTEAVFTNYIQPACIWHHELAKKLPNSEIYGTIVGWGLENENALAPQLREAKMPLISEITCIKSNPLFYSKLLEDNKKFCAGYRNGTSACNGDSGSAFLLFVPDKEKDDSPEADGAYYVRGIVSTTLALTKGSICNPENYAIFTDVEKYRPWIEKHL